MTSNHEQLTFLLTENRRLLHENDQLREDRSDLYRQQQALLQEQERLLALLLDVQTSYHAIHRVTERPFSE